MGVLYNEANAFFFCRVEDSLTPRENASAGMLYLLFMQRMLDVNFIRNRHFISRVVNVGLYVLEFAE